VGAAVDDMNRLAPPGIVRRVMSHDESDANGVSGIIGRRPAAAGRVSVL
jgi:hypothetical protein